MLVELSDQAIERLKSYDEKTKSIHDMSIEEFSELKMQACKACNSVLLDLMKAEILNTIGNEG